jgi:hypothetical protein
VAGKRGTKTKNKAIQKFRKRLERREAREKRKREQISVTMHVRVDYSKEIGKADFYMKDSSITKKYDKDVDETKAYSELYDLFNTAFYQFFGMYLKELGGIIEGMERDSKRPEGIIFQVSNNKRVWRTYNQGLWSAERERKQAAEFFRGLKTSTRFF